MFTSNLLSYLNPPKEFVASAPVTVQTEAGFDIRYLLTLNCWLLDKKRFKDWRMLEKKSQDELVEFYNGYRLDGGRDLFFHLALRWVSGPEDIEHAIHAPVCRIISEKGSFVIREIADKDLILDLHKNLFTHRAGACTATLKDFERDLLCRETIEKNYAMLNEEQKQVVMADERYGQYEQMLAAAALKRRLDFLENKPEQYESEMFWLETERVGRGLKISWRLKPEAKQGGYDIVGFRRTGGFHADQWDEATNGPLVIHSSKDGESVELLSEGEAQFYTFFLKPWREDKKHFRRSPLRFQVTIPIRDETDPIRVALETIERQRFNPPAHNVSRALKELGLSMEFDNAIDQRKRAIERQIEMSNDRPEEKEEKLSRLRDVVAAVRDKYQL